MHQSILILFLLLMTACSNSSDTQSSPILNTSTHGNIHVVIFRHGEKPTDAEKKAGLDGPDLTGTGVLRAYGLQTYLTGLLEQKNWTLGGIYGMFADSGITACPDPSIPIDASYRPWQTVTPFADNHNTLNGAFDHCHYTDLVEDIRHNSRYANTSVFICWDHTQIPDILKAFGFSETELSNNHISKWPGTVFNWLVQFDIQLGTHNVSNLTISDQNLPNGITIPSWASYEPPISEPDFLPAGLSTYCTQASDKSYTCNVNWEEVNSQDVTAYGK